MMVLVASVLRPCWDAGRDTLCRDLEDALRDRGHEVEAIRFPFDPEPDALWPQLFALRMTNFSDVAELLIATDPPCHLLRHRRKVLWLTEHYPSLGDGRAALEALQPSDQLGCGEAAAAFAVSQQLCDRVTQSSGRDFVSLSPPPAGSWDHVVAQLTGHDGR